MSLRILIVGAGRQAQAAAFDLAKFDPGVELTMADVDLGRADAAAQRVRSLIPAARMEPVAVSATEPDRISELALHMDGVLAGVPYHLNPLVHLAAGRVGKPSVDMGSDLEDLESALGPYSEYRASTAVFDSGLAPGLGNQLAAMLIDEVPGIESMEILCGGLPLEPRTPMRYKPRFSLEGLIGEYTDPAIALRDGKIVELASLTEVETVPLGEIGTFEAFVTSGGSSIGPMLHQKRLRNYAYKTLRFPGHAAAMAAYRDLGLWEDANRPHFERLFTQATAREDDRDQVILAVTARGAHTKRIVVRQEFDAETGLSAMEQLTGFSAAIVLKKVLEAGQEPGLYAAEEVVSGGTMLEELARRRITAQVD